MMHEKSKALLGLTPKPARFNIETMLAAWSGDRDVAAARMHVDSDITAVELAQRITKVKLR